MKRKNQTLRAVSLCFALFIVASTGFAQDKSDFKTTVINKKVKDFPERYSRETPLEAYLSVSYITANGKQSMWRPYSTYRFRHSFAGEEAPDETVSDASRDEIFNREIMECIVYRDSAAAVITTWDEDSLYLIRYLSREDGLWLNAGENMGRGFAQTREDAIGSLPVQASFIPMIEIVRQTPADTANFVNYLKTNGREPHRYIIDKLAKHRIVIYGEFHRRKVSWNLLKQVISEPEFAETTGAVFFELPSHMQDDLDRFYAQEELDTGILLDIFGSEQINGWHDKDEFDFMVALWELNKGLSADKKIKVVLTDNQAPWGSMKTAEDFRNRPLKDRNTNMADVIEQTMKTTAGSRSGLFIVGYMHAYRSSRVAGMFSTPNGLEAAPTAGAQLVGRFAEGDVFGIFPHCMSGSNRGERGGKIRNGLFDYVFGVNGNVPVAFDLAGSPFGREPFDASLEVKFNPRIGSYGENYDGYIFFGKLEDEEKGNPLYELFTDGYVEEVKRRASISGMREDRIWYDVPLKELTKEVILESMRKEARGKMWPEAE
ncbi:MAG: hypothetical protein LBK65_04760 [Tannerellaceae bacterium]|jgi:hypothetical protein|nr:hypothetical protein [Tannerellaceae bacterium]